MKSIINSLRDSIRFDSELLLLTIYLLRLVEKVKEKLFFQIEIFDFPIYQTTFFSI